MSERYGGDINGEFNSVEDNEASIRRDVELNSHRPCKFARAQVRF